MAILFYLAVTIASVAAVIAAAWGWRPEWVPLWDLRAQEVMITAGVVSALGGSWGLGATLARLWKSRRMSWAPLAPFCIAMAPIEAARTISPDMSAGEVLAALTFPVELGLGLALAVVLVDVVFSFARKRNPDEETDARVEADWPWSHLLGVPALLGVWGVAAALILTPHRPDNGRFLYRASFPASCGAIGVAAYRPPLSNDSYGEVLVRDGRRWRALTLGHEQWPKLQRLWTAAHGTDLEWHEGRIYGGGFSDPGQLDFAIGPPARFVISSRRGPTVACDLPAAQFAGFGRALDKVSDQLKWRLPFVGA